MRNIFLLAALAAALSVPSVRAQNTFASLEGTITDTSHAVIPQVKVTAKNTETGLIRSALTDTRGFYRIPSLPPGTYEVRAEAKGLAIGIQSGVSLTINQSGVADITLKPSGVEQTIAVEANVAAVDTVSSERGDVIAGKQAADLPLNGRSFDQLLVLVPGIIQTNSSVLGYSTNGLRPGGNNFLVNGADANDNYFPENVNGRSGITFTSLGSASVDEIQEFRVVTNNYSSEYGRLAGAQINVATKSGTNSLHGTLFDFEREPALQARSYFNVVPLTKVGLTRHQFGGNLGGPIKHNKLFFFFNYEGMRQVTPSTGKALVPTDLAEQTAPAVFKPYWQFITKPTTPYYNADGSVNLYAGYVNYGVESPAHENTFTFRGDYLLSSKDTLALSDHEDFGRSLSPGAVNVLSTSGQSANNHVANITETHIVGPDMANVLILGFNRGPRMFYYDPSLNGIQNVPTPLVSFSVSGYWSGGGTSNYSYYPTTAYQADDNLTWDNGPHRLKAGIDIRHVGEVFNTGPSTSLSYLNITDFFNNSLYQYSQTTVNASKSYGITSYAAFVQDDLKVSRRLNINLGLRYEYNAPVEERHMRQSSYELSDHQLHVGEALYNARTLNFAPRLGFAYTLTGDGKTVLRGGWGIFYDAMNPTQFIFQAINPPFAYSYLVQRATNPTLTYPLPSSFTTATPPASTVYGFDPNAKNGMVQQYNLDIQREILREGVFEIGAVGSRGVHLLMNRNWNLPDPTTKVRPDTRYASIIIRESSAQSWYNSLQASFKSRARHGLVYQLTYTWGHMLDDAGSSYESPQNVNCIRCDYANSEFDRRHNFVAGFTYETPFGRGRRIGSQWGGFTNAILGGWQMNGIAIGRTGLPFSISSGVDTVGQGVVTRPDAVVGVSPYAPGKSTNLWLNLAAFATPPSGRYGNLGRDTVYGAGAHNLDFSVFKNFATPFFAKEKATLQFRGEFYNVFNTPSFGSPVSSMTSLQFGQFTSTVPTGNDSRQIQLAFKLIF